MSNHPNRGPKGPASNPSPEQVKAVRAATGLTQTQAAAVVYSTIKSWQTWEAGTRRMPPGLYELFLIKTGQHRRYTMITNIELTQSGTDKFNKFFADHARDGVSIQAVLFEMLDILQDRAGMDEALSYELGRAYTSSGNPEVLTLDAEDVLLTTEDDE